MGVKGISHSKKSVCPKSDSDKSEESSGEEMENASGDEEKSLVTSPQEKKSTVKNSGKNLKKGNAKIAKSNEKKADMKVENSQMVVKVLDLKGESKNAISVGRKQKPKVSQQSSVHSQKPEPKKSSFFVGGESDDDSGGGGSGEEDVEEESGPLVPGGGDQYFAKNWSGGKFSGQRGRGGGGGLQRPVQSGGLAEENLHPSWQAKKRAPPAMAQFQGKKTKFGAEGGETVKSNPAPPQVAKSQEPVRVHPSWAAKQSQKSTIQSFQGKKMVFDD